MQYSLVSAAIPVSGAAKLAALALLPLLLASLWLGIGNLSFVRASNRLSDQVHEEQLAVETLLSTLRDAETGQRGFLLTGDSDYLEPFTSAVARMSADIADLQRASARDKTGGTTIGQIRTLAIAKMTELTRAVVLHQTGHGDAALALVRAGYGRRLTDALRAEIEIMRAKEKMRLSECRRAPSRAAHGRSASPGWRAWCFLAWC